MWFAPDGTEMPGAAWSEPERRAIGMLLAGDEIDGKTDLGHQLSDDTFFLALNASAASVPFKVPDPANATNGPWEVMVDTATSKIPVMRRITPGEPLVLVAKSFALLRRPRD